MTVLVYVVRFTITPGTELAGINITSGPLHIVFTVTGTSTARLSSTVQVRLSDLDPAITPSTGGVTVTVLGAGTEMWQQR